MSDKPGKTYSAIDVLSKVSGISKEEVQKIANEVQENIKRLNSCRGPHEFVPIPKELLRGSPKMRCTICKGWLDATAAKWYERGLEHGKRAK